LSLFERRHRVQQTKQPSISGSNSGIAAVEPLIDRILGCGGSLTAAHQAGKAIFLATPRNPSGNVEPDFLERPWKWLADTAEAAEAEGRWEVSAKIALACHLWNHTILATDPKIQVGSLVPTPPDAEARIHEVGVRCLRDLPPQQQLYADSGGAFLVGDARSRIARQLLRLAEQGLQVTPEARLLAEATDNPG
jgi:hypothetical protein